MNPVMEAEFKVWYAEYPRKIAPLAARKAYEKARKIATAQQLLDGVAAYRQHKPKWQQWAHASSWLNAGRWADEYETTPAPTARELPDWYAEAYAAAEAREQARAEAEKKAQAS